MYFPPISLNKELFMRSVNTREFVSESNDHSLLSISEIQFGTINLIKNRNQHRNRILLLLYGGVIAIW